MSRHERAPGKENGEHLGSLLNNPVVKNTFNEFAAKHIAQPKFAPELDVSFAQKGDRKNTPIGLPLFGLDNCAGIVAVRSTRQLESTERKLRENPNLAHIFEAGGDIAILTRPDIRAWTDFYNYVSQEGQNGEPSWLEYRGQKVLDFSGLERVTINYCDSLWDFTNHIIQRNRRFFADYNVGSFEYNEGESTPDEVRLDIPFLSRDGHKQRFVPLSHVREGGMEGELLEEKVYSQSIRSPGIIMPRPGENKGEVYVRAQAAQTYWQEIHDQEYDTNEKIIIPVGYSGQNSLWNKLGIESTLSANIEGSEITTEDIVRFLFLGESNLHPGVLGRMGYSLPGQIESMIRTNEKKRNGNKGIFSGADLVFFKRNTFNQRQRASIPWPIRGINLNKYKREIFETKAISNIGAIAIVPENWTAEQMHIHAKSVQSILAQHGGDPTSLPLFVTSRLFRRWQTEGFFMTEEEISSVEQQENHPSLLKKRAEYGLGLSSDAQIGYFRMQREPQIGGNFDGIYEVTNEGKVIHVINMSEDFGEWSHPATKEFTGQKSITHGARPFLKDGSIPMIPGLVDLEFLGKTLASARKNFPNLFENNPRRVTASYTLAELAKRGGLEFFEKILGDEKEAKKYYKQALKNIPIWYGNGDWLIKNFIPQHGHIDHVGLMSYGTREIPVIGRSELISMLHVISKQSRKTNKRPLLTPLYSEGRQVIPGKKGTSFPTVERPTFRMFRDDQVVQLSNNLSLQIARSNHSLHSVVQLLRSRNGNFVNMGDIRPGSLSENAVSLFANTANIVAIEATKSISEKPLPTQNEVRRSLDQTLAENVGSVGIAVSPKNDPETLALIYQVAQKHGRRLALSYKHIGFIEQFQHDQKLAPLNAQDYGIELPTVGIDVDMFARPIDNASTYEKSLIDQIGSRYPGGIVDANALSKYPGDWLVVVDPYQPLENLFDGLSLEAATGLFKVWLSYKTYETGSKKVFCSNADWIEGLKWYYPDKNLTLYADFIPRGTSQIQMIPTHPGRKFRYGGHGHWKFIADAAIELLHNNQGDIIITHTETPDIAARSMADYYNQLNRQGHQTAKLLQEMYGSRSKINVSFRSHLTPYNPREPLTDQNPLGLNTFVFPFNY